MGDYSRKAGRARHGPHGKKPTEEGVGFSVQLMELPDQEGDDDPVVMYKVTDRFDDEVVLSGCEVASKAAEVAQRQLFLMMKAGGVVGTHELLLTELSKEDDGDES